MPANAKPAILILCTGNSCRSHIGEGFLRAALGDLANVHSAGSNPAGYVHPLAIKVMAEAGIDISTHRSKHLKEFLGQPVTTVVTVCDNADQACPLFPGQVNRTTGLSLTPPKPPARMRKSWRSSAMCAMRCAASLKPTPPASAIRAKKAIHRGWPGEAGSRVRVAAADLRPRNRSGNATASKRKTLDSKGPLASPNKHAQVIRPAADVIFGTALSETDSAGLLGEPEKYVAQQRKQKTDAHHEKHTLA